MLAETQINTNKIKKFQNWMTDFVPYFCLKILNTSFNLTAYLLKIFCSLPPTVQSHNYFRVHSADKVNSDMQNSKTSELFFHVFAFNPDHLTINICLFLITNSSSQLKTSYFTFIFVALISWPEAHTMLRMHCSMSC